MDRKPVVLDPIHGYIELEPLLQPLIDDPLVQRLRRISQTSTARSTYPSLTGTRFEHALGVMHLAKLAWTHAWNNSSAMQSAFQAAAESDIGATFGVTFSEQVRIAVGAVGLLHDVGHPPFSHAMEAFYSSNQASVFQDGTVRASFRSSRAPFHELAGRFMASQLIERVSDEPYPHLKDIIRSVLNASPSSGTWAGAVKSIVSGEIDIDRLDYLLRDAFHAGTEYGAIDHSRVVSAIEIREPTKSEFVTGVGYRARSAAEQLLLQRVQSYRWMYYHQRVVLSDHLLLRCTEIARRLGRSSDAQVRWQTEDVPAGMLFRKLEPNLDYLSPDAQSLLPTILDFGGSPSSPPETAESEAEAEFEDLAGQFNVYIDEIARDLRCNVDDSAVLTWLAQAALLARSLLWKQSTKSARTAGLLQLYLRYYDSLIHRHKNFLAVWKGFDDYRRLAETFASSVDYPALVADAFGKLFDESPGLGSDHFDALQTLFAQEQAAAYSRIERPVAVLNHVVTTLIAGRERAFAEHLNRSVNLGALGLVGVWEVAYKQVVSIKRDRQMARLFKGDDEESLSETSPLLRNLEDVVGESVKFFTYYCVFEYNGSMTPYDLRTRLQKALISALPSFSEDVLPQVMREQAKELVRLQRTRGLT